MLAGQRMYPVATGRALHADQDAYRMPLSRSAALPTGVVEREIARWRLDGSHQARDAVAEEAPVAVHCHGRSFAVMMASPQDLDDFALGFALSEGLVATPAQLLAVDTRALLEGIVLDLRLADGAPGLQETDPDQARLLPGRSGCGICGTRDLQRAVRMPPPLAGDIRTTHAAIERALAQLAGHQPMNAATGAVHAAAWATPDGQVHVVREDVGRHNALDKVVGALHRQQRDPATGMLVITSRASHEMVSKAALAGASVLVAISAPTALAIGVARSAGMTLVGFARPGSHNIYSHGQRIVSA